MPGQTSSEQNKAAAHAIPKAMLPTYAAVVALTDAVCAEHLSPEYADLARRMAAALCRKRPSPLVSGQPKTWASGIIHALGQMNFLSDPSFPPVMTTAQLAAAFGVGQSTIFAKAKVISATLKTRIMDPDWTLPSLLERNPLVWMAEVNGLLVDLRHMPREVQEIAFEKGLIPFIPADRPTK